MKKFFLLLSLFLICSTVFANAALSSTQDFDLTLTKQFKNFGYFTTASSIMEDESTRSSVSCSLLIDLVSAGKNDFTTDNFTDCILTSSNIFTNGDYIGVSAFFNHKVVHIAYDPTTESVTYTVDDAGSGSDEFNCIYDSKTMEGKGFTVYTNTAEEMQRVFYILVGQD